MRRLWAAGAAIFVCLALGAVSASAQSPSSPSPGAPADYAAVTGKNYCGITRVPGTWQEATAPYTLSGMLLGCSYGLSDPRVSGKGTVGINLETWHPGFDGDIAEWGDATIEGPDGTWTGRHYGFYDTKSVVHDMTILAGGGAYEGWTFIFSTTVPSGTTGDIIGVIHHSPPPPGFPVEPFPAISASPAP